MPVFCLADSTAAAPSWTNMTAQRLISKSTLACRSDNRGPRTFTNDTAPEDEEAPGLALEPVDKGFIWPPGLGAWLANGAPVARPRTHGSGRVDRAKGAELWQARGVLRGRYGGCCWLRGRLLAGRS